MPLPSVESESVKGAVSAVRTGSLLSTRTHMGVDTWAVVLAGL